MKRLAVVVCIVTSMLLSGCCCSCPGDCVPVSMEGCYDWLRFHGACYRRFPHSCPPCPYYSGVAGHHQVYNEYEVPKGAAKRAPAPLDASDDENSAESAADLPPTPEPDGE